MKFFTSVNSLNPKRLLAFTMIIAGTLLMQSCGKDETVVNEASSITVITAVPSLGTNNVYLGSTMLNSAPLPFAERIPYRQIPTGTQNVKFTTGNSTTSLISKDVQFANNTIYTLILTGRPNNLEFLVQTDAIAAPASGKALLRFINLSPDAPSLDVFIKDGASVTSVITDRAYKASSSYIEVEAKKYIFILKDHVTGEVKKELAETTLAEGKVYTIFASGLLTNTADEQPFTGKVISH